MTTKRIKGTPHSEEVIGRIIQLCDEGMRSKDIYKQSKDMFGYVVKQSTISQILNKNGRTPKENTFRVRKAWKKYKTPKTEETKKTGLTIYKPDTKPTEVYEDYVEPEMIDED
jgi:hypothetical protein